MEKLRYYLQWWFEYELPEFIPRFLDPKILKTKLIPVLVGVRRCGKSTLLFQMISELRQKVPARNILYINFEDDRLLPLDGSELKHLLQIYRQYYNPAKNAKIFLFIDEIQNLPGWESTVRRLYETEPSLKLVLTGSNSKMLSREIATALRGRTLPIQVFPLSFKEFLSFKNIEVPELDHLMYSSALDGIFFAFDQYLRYGGFPAVVLEADEELKEAVLKEYLNTIFFRDIVERYNVRNYRVLEIFIKILARQNASLVSYGKLTNALRSIGVSLSKNSVIDYFSYVEDAMLGHLLPIYSYSVKNQLQYPKKFYLVDPGLFRSVAFLKEKDYGHLLENLVFNHLRRKHKEIFYWKDRNGYEVDFVLPDLLMDQQDYALIQVTYEWNEAIQKRELRALRKAASEFKVNKVLIITRDHSEMLFRDDLEITILPFVAWSLIHFK